MDVSVIVPIYNVEKYLKCCLESLVKQVFSGDYEIICINDGSTDDSLKIIKEYESLYSNVRVIDQENKGLSGARNSGIKISRGDYIIFLDSDDYLKDENAIDIMYRQAIEHKLDIVIVDFEYNFEQKTKNYRLNRSNVIKNKILSGQVFFDEGIRTKSISSVVWNKMYKRDFIEQNKLYFIEGILHEDMEYTPRALYKANKVKYVDKVLIAYRQREGSIMSSNKQRNKAKDYVTIIESLEDMYYEFKTQSLSNQIAYIYIKLLGELREVVDREYIKDSVKKLLESNAVFNRKTNKLYIIRILGNVLILKLKGCYR